MMRYRCCDERRRNEIDGRPDLDGIDFLEVLDDPALPLDQRQRTLFVHFINSLATLTLGPENVWIGGGERIRDLRVTDARIEVHPRSGSSAPVLVVEVDRPGDFSTYTLRLVADPANTDRLDDIDPILRAVDFSFKVSCDTEFDCAIATVCPPRPSRVPLIDYLARDFRSLRQLLLDRMAVLAPSWTERNAADLGVTLVELLAYVGDYLSYRQDAVATEAYLGTARRRVSVRRHVRLVDYFMHDGCNARVWACFRLEGGELALPKGTQLLTLTPEVSPRLQPGSPGHRRALAAGATAFETMEPALLSPRLNEIELYTWGARQCCLPRGATRASLRGDLTALLKPGSVLVFEEVRSPRTGDPDDANLQHRQAVRLAEVRRNHDPIGRRFDEPPSEGGVDVTDIAWAEADALVFPLCASAEADAAFGGGFVDRVSVAHGNVVLADHGRTLDAEEDLDSVPTAGLLQVPAEPDEPAAGTCRPRELRPLPLPPRFHPQLRVSPLTQAVPHQPESPPASAAAALAFEAGSAVPAVIRLVSRLDDGSKLSWTPRRDLLNSQERREFVVEVEGDGRAFLRFGDGRHGARPPEGARFAALYRVGNGSRGNIGADTLGHIVSDDAAVLGIARLTMRNPLPAVGGRDPETNEEVRRRAPFAFRTQQRAVTLADYAERAGSHAGVQRAAATLRWTGSWYTHFLSIDRRGGLPIDADFERDLRRHLEPFRLAGHDVEIDRPRLVALEVAMRVRVRPEHFRSDIRRALLDRLGNRTLPDGRRSVFHPDNLTFGQTVYPSPIYAAAQSVEGVESVEITTFQRRDVPDPQGLEEGRIRLGRMEIARLDNDRNFPDRGLLHLELEGGQ